MIRAPSERACCAAVLKLLTAMALLCALPSSTPLLAQTSVALEYSQARFDVDLDPWHLFTVEGIHRTGRGDAIARGNFARRFGRTGEQAELELYPKFGSATSLYLGAGYSASDLFPETRLGAELFHSPRRGLEASAGVRYLDFEARAVTLYTGSVAWYPPHYYFAVRPFAAWNAGKLAAAGSVQVRRYLGDEDQWVALIAGGGQILGDDITAFELERLGSLTALLMGRMRAGSRVALRWSAGYEWEQLSAPPNRNRLTFGIGVERRF